MHHIRIDDSSTKACRGFACHSKALRQLSALNWPLALFHTRASRSHFQRMERRKLAMGVERHIKMWTTIHLSNEEQIFMWMWESSKGPARVRVQRENLCSHYNVRYHSKVWNNYWIARWFPFQNVTSNHIILFCYLFIDIGYSVISFK